MWSGEISLVRPSGGRGGGRQDGLSWLLGDKCNGVWVGLISEPRGLDGYT